MRLPAAWSTTCPIAACISPNAASRANENTFENSRSNASSSPISTSRMAVGPLPASARSPIDERHDGHAP